MSFQVVCVHAICPEKNVHSFWLVQQQINKSNLWVELSHLWTQKKVTCSCHCSTGNWPIWGAIRCHKSHVGSHIPEVTLSPTKKCNGQLSERDSAVALFEMFEKQPNTAWLSVLDIHELLQKCFKCKQFCKSWCSVTPDFDNQFWPQNVLKPGNKSISIETYQTTRISNRIDKTPDVWVCQGSFSGFHENRSTVDFKKGQNMSKQIRNGVKRSAGDIWLRQISTNVKRGDYPKCQLDPVILRGIRNTFRKANCKLYQHPTCTEFRWLQQFIGKNNHWTIREGHDRKRHQKTSKDLTK